MKRSVIFIVLTTMSVASSVSFSVTMPWSCTCGEGSDDIVRTTGAVIEHMRDHSVLIVHRERTGAFDIAVEDSTM